jgi:CBS domain-containing protein
LPAPGTSAIGPGKTARHVMRSDVFFIPPDVSISRALHLTIGHDAPAFLVGTQSRLAGAVTRDRLVDAATSDAPDAPISSIVDAAPVHAHPDHPLDVVFERFAESGGVLPIVSRAEATRVEGVVTRDAIMTFAEKRASS